MYLCLGCCYVLYHYNGSLHCIKQSISGTNVTPHAKAPVLTALVAGGRHWPNNLKKIAISNFSRKDIRVIYFGIYFTGFNPNIHARLSANGTFPSQPGPTLWFPEIRLPRQPSTSSRARPGAHQPSVKPPLLSEYQLSTCQKDSEEEPLRAALFTLLFYFFSLIKSHWLPLPLPGI